MPVFAPAGLKRGGGNCPGRFVPRRFETRLGVGTHRSASNSRQDKQEAEGDDQEDSDDNNEVHIKDKGLLGLGVEGVDAIKQGHVCCGSGKETRSGSAEGSGPSEREEGQQNLG